MTNNNSKYVFSGVALLSIVVFGFAPGIRVEANTTSEDASEERELFWMKAKERAEERKNQIEKNWEEKQVMMEEKKEERQEKICSNLVNRNEKMSERIGERYEKLLERKTKRTDIFEEKRSSRDAKLDEHREDRDARRSEMYAKLLERAGDDTEKQAAVATFKTAIEQAVSDRKAAVDAAIAAFRAGVDAAVGGRKDTMDESIADFKAAAEAAFAKAKSDCESGVDPKDVRETLAASLEAARKNIQDDRAAAEKVGTQVKALAETKKVAFEKALSDFKAAAEAARTNLKAVFGSDSDETEGE